MAVKVSVDLHGIFFTGNPVGRLHRNVYDVLKEEGDYAVEASKRELGARQRTYGRGGSRREFSGAAVILADNIVKQPMRMRRSLMRVVVSANYGPQPWARKYNRYLDTGEPKNRYQSGSFRGYHFYRRGARQTQAHIDGRIGQIANHLVEGIT